MLYIFYFERNHIIDYIGTKKKSRRTMQVHTRPLQLNATSSFEQHIIIYYSWAMKVSAYSYTYLSQMVKR